MPRRITVDANVILRVLLKDTTHPRYLSCVSVLNSMCLVTDYVFPEVVYAYLAKVRKHLAYVMASSLGELEEFNRSPRLYTAKCRPLSGWKKDAYARLESDMQELLDTYQGLSMYDIDLYEETLQVAKSTGLDWVDCTLIASHRLYDTEVFSIDTDIVKSLDRGFSPMSFV